MAKLLVLGGGESGRGVALLAQHHGYEVFVSDAGKLSASAKTELVTARIPFEEGGHGVDVLMGVGLVVKSPGIPWEAALVVSARKAGLRVVGEMEFCAPYKRGHLVGITGSNGKTTTTLLVHHLLKAAGLAVVAGGNVGTSYARLLLGPVQECYVLELSSFQLEDIESFHVDLGMVLNLSPDHLDRYGGSFEAYAAAKYRLKRTRIARPALWLQAGDEVSHAYDPGSNGASAEVVLPATYRAGTALAPWGDVSLRDTTLHGAHNAANATFALFAAEGAIAMTRGAAAAKAARPVLAEALKTFVNAPHRLETVGFVDGIRFVNDSKATNLDAALQALGAFAAPVVWVVGGQDKGNDYSLVKPEQRQALRSLVALGKDNHKILAAFADLDQEVHDTASISDALAKACMDAQSGDVVLLSPACASFDLFDNYIDRGTRFREAVRALPGFSETLLKQP